MSPRARSRSRPTARIRNRRVAVRWGLLLLVLAGGASARTTAPGEIPEAADAPQPLAPPMVHEYDLADEASLQRLITAAYDRMVAYSRPSGKRLEIELSDFETILRDAFSTTYWSAIADGPQERAVNVVRTRHVSTVDTERSLDGVQYGETTVYYDPHLVPRELAWIRVSEASRTPPEATVASILEEGAVYDEGLSGVVALTTYRVHLTLDGQSLDYRAAFLWWPPSGEGDDFRGNLRPIDQVLDAIDRVIVETLPVSPPWVTGPQSPDSGDRSESSDLSASTGTCREFSNTRGPGYTYEKGYNGHIGAGFHGIQADLKVRCSCTSGCASECRGIRKLELCWDEPPTDNLGCHKLSTDGAREAKRVDDGTTSGATCGVGFGCAQKSCFGPCTLCGPADIRITGTGAGLSLSTNGADWKRLLKYARTCSRCIAFDPPDEGPTAPDQGGETTPPNGCTDCGPCNCSPIVIDLDRGGFRLTSLEDGVAFDLDGNGDAEHTAWTVPDPGDAFLVLDRDGNGAIDDGTELFGTSTPQPQTDEWNGYNALQVFDWPENGGNGDGWIDADDAVFERLRLWKDFDGDGVSRPNELFPLAQQGVRRIALTTTRSGRRDRHGNELRFQSLVDLDRGRTQSADVFFVYVD